MVALVAICLLSALFQWREDNRLHEKIGLEATWRAAMNSKLDRLLTALDHARCEDIETLQETVNKIQEELANELSVVPEGDH